MSNYVFECLRSIPKLIFHVFMDIVNANRLSPPPRRCYIFELEIWRLKHNIMLNDTTLGMATCNQIQNWIWLHLNLTMVYVISLNVNNNIVVHSYSSARVFAIWTIVFLLHLIWFVSNNIASRVHIIRSVTLYFQCNCVNYNLICFLLL